jgi:hypothetical protein
MHSCEAFTISPLNLELVLVPDSNHSSSSDNNTNIIKFRSTPLKYRILHKFGTDSNLSQHNLSFSPSFDSHQNSSEISSLKLERVTNQQGIYTARLFSVCAVQTNRNPLSPYHSAMFVAHYLSLGFRVIFYDRLGLHAGFIQRYLKNPLFDYHPYTLLELARPSAIDLKISMDFKYKVYYSKEHNSVNSLISTASDTLMQDRDKMATFDHAIVEYSALEDDSFLGIFFVDIDEFLYCPGVKGNSTYAAQKIHINRVFNMLRNRGIDELRVDVHPYAASVDSAGISETESCFQRAQDVHAMHSCMSGHSTYQMWPKSLDFRQRCPFHYNHWSCDGGRGGGRQYGCFCRVSREWYSKSKKKLPTGCHLIHYNHHIYKYQEHRPHHQKHEIKLNFTNSSPISKLMSLIL